MKVACRHNLVDLHAHIDILWLLRVIPQYKRKVIARLFEVVAQVRRQDILQRCHSDRDGLLCYRCEVANEG